MIFAPGIPGVAFGTLDDGDGRSDARARRSIAETLGIPDSWAYVDQVHGAEVLFVEAGGNHGPADGLITGKRLLPLAIGTADCVPVAFVSPTAVAIVHAGWRGVAAGVVGRALASMEKHGPVSDVVIGPHIGSCCYEVGPEVVQAVGGYGRKTTYGTPSIDLGSAIEAQVDDKASVRSVSACTKCDERFASHRRDGTKIRQVSVAWRT